GGGPSPGGGPPGGGAPPPVSGPADGSVSGYCDHAAAAGPPSTGGRFSVGGSTGGRSRVGGSTGGRFSVGAASGRPSPERSPSGRPSLPSSGRPLPSPVRRVRSRPHLRRAAGWLLGDPAVGQHRDRRAHARDLVVVDLGQQQLRGRTGLGAHGPV